MKPSVLSSRLLACILCVSILSCGKDVIPSLEPLAVFPKTEQEKEKAELHTDFANILRKIYQSKEAFHEVQATIWSGYYQDERVLLKALLSPGTHPLYTRDAFKNFNIGKGAFKKQFDQLISENGFPLLGKYLEKAGYIPGQDWPSGQSITQMHAVGSFDPDLGSEDGLSIYFPYSENYRPVVQESGENWLRATLVAADRDADEAPGLEPADCPANDCYTPVTVNDDYCEANIVHIAGSGAIQAVPTSTGLPTTINMVMIGSVKCRNQYDHLISFTGNGGGSELRFVRADSYLEQNSNGQITSPKNVLSVNCSRKDIRKQRWIEVNAIWDSNWEADNPEQVFAIYEEDNEGSRKLSGSIQAKIKSLTIEPIKYEFSVQTRDDIIRQLGWKRNSFFAFNQGGLNNGCGLLNGFTVYDCQLPVAYTMPVRKQ